MRPVVRLSALTLAGALALAACSSQSDGKGSPLLGLQPHAATTSPVAVAHSATHSPAPSAPSAFPSSSSSSSPTPNSSTSSGSSTPVSSSVPSSSGSAAHVPNELDPLLLTGADVGAGFAPAQQSAPEPLPCTPNQPPVDDQLAHVEKAGTSLLNSAEGTQVSEEVYVYGSATDAVRHQQISEAGLACTKGTEDGAPIDIAGPTDVAKQLMTNTSKAEAWTVANSEIGGSLVLVRINAVVVQFSFVANAGVHPKVSAQKVIDLALAKIVGGR